MFAAGALAGKADIVAAVRSMHNVLGGTVDPFAAFLLLRGMKTLGVRVRQQNETAMEIARRLEGHPHILRVRSKGISHHPTCWQESTVEENGQVCSEFSGVRILQILKILLHGWLWLTYEGCSPCRFTTQACQAIQTMILHGNR